MIVVRGLAPNAAYLRLLSLATQQEWRVEDSRAGVCRDLGAVTVELDGGERTMLLVKRGWNPAFALVEAAWVMSGRNDVKTLAEFVRNFDRYSDDGRTLQGAYGHRLRHYFGRDQVDAAVAELSRQPQSRRVVLSLYAASDLGLASEDIPCNTHVTFRRVEGRLEMTVSNRSNDLWLGVPYNWFVFRVLQHEIAGRLHIPCGIQRHVSSCLHLYDRDVAAARDVVSCNREVDLIREEAELAGLNVQGLLDDVPALADLSFDRLSSEQLVHAFSRYRSYRDTGVAAPESSPALDVLATSLDRWYFARHSSEVNAMSKTPSYNGETETGLRIQRWVAATPSAVAAEQLNLATEKALPVLRETLQLELGPGVRVGFEDAASERRASLHFLFELILGTLDPELVRTGIGDRLRKQVTDIAAAAGLTSKTILAREVPDEVLLNLFGDLLA